MTTLFISYRRDDSAGYAGRLYDRLAARYGGECVFMDYYDLPPGGDFPELIATDLKRADIVLAVIGPRWVDARDEAGTRRLGKAGDFVTRELSDALTQGKLTIPVLVGGARMPGESDLPQELATLARLQAWELRDARFDDDMQALLAQLKPPEEAPAPVATTIVGDWEADVRYAWGESARERFHFEIDGEELFGYGTFLTGKHPLEETELLADGARFVLHSEAILGADERRRVKHSYRVRIDGATLQIRMQSTGGFSDEPPLKFSARRV